MDDGFKVGAKVFLDGEYGVVINLKKHEVSTIIRWDTPMENDIEDWCSMWGTFIQMGGIVIDPNHQFQYIQDDGSLKDNI